ncbi:uncharacterized protein LOC133908961 [Phragmites australis]|uniref:uncharacterized protein LOC133908961 n=1 Tax=Phragmites australis TaxID=29695 RepID=UPI002D775EC9|nr:uncharacterized protein LOC133908961 [Phragmites australis]
MDHQLRQRHQRSTRGNASGSESRNGNGSGGASSGRHKGGGGGKGGGKKPIKVVYISNPMRVKTSASGFRALVQELTGRHADPSKYSPEDLSSVGGGGADEEAEVAGIDGAAQGLSPGGAAASSDTVVASPSTAADHQLDAATVAPHGGDYDEDEDDDVFRSQLLENNYAMFSPPTLLYDHHPHSKFPYG